MKFCKHSVLYQDQSGEDQWYVMNYLKRGSRKSLVKTIHIASDGRQEKERSMPDQGSGTNLHRPESIVDSTSTLRDSIEKTQQEIKRLQVENQRQKEARITAEDQVNYLKNLLKERESEILSLSTRIEALTVSNNELKENQCSQLYEAKMQYMIDIEMELKRVKDESAKMVARLHKKVKRLQETNLKSKQEYALKAFALKDEKNKLLEENEALSQGLNDTIPSADDRNYENNITHSLEDENSKQGSRNKLIVQLSQQVTSLDVENQELRQELEKAKTLINMFKDKVKGRTLEVNTKTQQKHERQELCVNIASLDIGSSSSEVELFG